MGTWAEDAFGNDTACDWAAEFSDEPSLDKVSEAINCALEFEEYLEFDEASIALVACEIVARLKGNWGIKSAYSEKVDKWIESVDVLPNAKLISNSKKVISLILGENSELQELWDEDGFNEKWHSEMKNLLERLSS